jgi:glycosyltransferase involved in cell wall biosynthesis
VHIGLNLIYLVPGETGGTETYARELIPALVDAAPSAQITAFINREAAACMGSAPWRDLIPSVTVPVSARNRAQWVRGEQQLLPHLAARTGVDLVHSLANTGPGWGRFRRVVTIHDLHFKLVPDTHLGLAGLGMRVLVPLSARRSHRIIVDAASTRGELEQHLGIKAEKVDPVPLGFGNTQRVSPLQATELRDKLGLGHREIVLSVSAMRPHKNLARLITAVGLIPVERRPILVIPGYSTPHEEELRRHAAELGLSDDLRLPGWIEPETLEGLYSAAACLVCASLHEGFGLPVLEAMARGLPVACSGRGALAEVGGDAVLRFDPESPEEIAAAIQRLLGDSAEAQRLRVAGLQRAGGFTWAQTAAGTLASYERVLS